jgi:hypothetical protein
MTQKQKTHEKGLKEIRHLKTIRPEERPHLYESLRTGKYEKAGREYKIDKGRRYRKGEK